MLFDMHSKLGFNRAWHCRLRDREPSNNKAATYLRLNATAMDQSVHNRAIAVVRKAKDLNRQVRSNVIVNAKTTSCRSNVAENKRKNFRNLCIASKNSRSKVNNRLLEKRLAPPESAFCTANFSGQERCKPHGSEAKQLSHLFSYVNLNKFKTENCYAVAKNLQNFNGQMLSIRFLVT